MAKPQLMILSPTEARCSVCSARFAVDPNNMTAARLDFEEHAKDCRGENGEQETTA
jgi:hypothetical protein